MVVNINKNGCMIELICNDDKIVKYDCKNKQIISFTNHIVKNFPSCISGTRIENIVRLLDMIKEDYRWKLESKNRLNYVEPFLPYFNKLDIYSFPSECPKGYINFVIENDLTFCQSSLREFYTFKKLMKFSEEEKQLFKALQSVCYYFNVNNYSEKELHIILKLLKTSMKKFYFDFKKILSNFFYEVNKCKSEWMKYIDINRDFEFNAELLKTKRDEIQNKGIIKTQEKLGFLNNTIIDDYIIIVPKNLNDLVDEGKQQQNCVGYHYNDSIVRDENLIYFIRNKETPEKSYITCRFNIMNKQTAEYKYRFNNYIPYESDDYKRIKMIDEIIVKNLY